MTPGQDEALAAALGHSHEEQAGFAYMILDGRSRRAILPWFFRSAIHLAELYGAIYVETFDESRLCCYRRQGFEIAGAGVVPGGGPAFWVMIRPPRFPIGPGILDRT